jgi:hypothetical protein
MTKMTVTFVTFMTFCLSWHDLWFTDQCSRHLYIWDLPKKMRELDMSISIARLYFQACSIPNVGLVSH